MALVCQAVTTPVTPTETSPPPVSIPDCGHGDRALDSSDQTVCNCSLTIVDDFCCNSGQKVLNGLCCDSEQILVDNQCADPIPPCELGKAATDNCICGGVIDVDGTCVSTCSSSKTKVENKRCVDNPCVEGGNTDTCSCSTDNKELSDATAGTSHCCPNTATKFENGACFTPPACVLGQIINGDCECVSGNEVNDNIGTSNNKYCCPNGATIFRDGQCESCAYFGEDLGMGCNQCNSLTETCKEPTAPQN